MPTTIVQCPTCKKDIVWELSCFRPFCSERCRLIDLGDWASEKFKVPGEKINPDNMPQEQESEDKKDKK